MYGLLKNFIHLFLGFVLFIALTVAALLYANTQQLVPTAYHYNNASSLTQASNIPIYDMYDASLYLLENQKELISSCQDMVFTHYKNQTEEYSIDHYKMKNVICSYWIQYKKYPIDVPKLNTTYQKLPNGDIIVEKPSHDILYHNLQHGEALIEKDVNAKGIRITYSSTTVSYTILLPFPDIDNLNIRDYESIVLNYIEDVYTLHHQ